MQAGDIVRARFTPRRTDDLRPEAAAYVGQTMTWTATWQIDEGFPYAGDWRMHLGDSPLRDEVGPFTWVPLCDLSDIEHVGVDPDFAWQRDE